MCKEIIPLKYLYAYQEENTLMSTHLLSNHLWALTVGQLQCGFAPTEIDDVTEDVTGKEGDYRCCFVNFPKR